MFGIFALHPILCMGSFFCFSPLSISLMYFFLKAKMSTHNGWHILNGIVYAIILSEWEFVKQNVMSMRYRNEAPKSRILDRLKACGEWAYRFTAYKCIRAKQAKPKKKNERKWCCHYSYCYFDCCLNLWCVIVILYAIAVA